MAEMITAPLKEEEKFPLLSLLYGNASIRVDCDGDLLAVGTKIIIEIPLKPTCVC